MNKVILKLFVIGQTTISRRAIKNLEIISLSPELKGRCEIEIINLYENQDMAEKEKILASPLLIKKLPLPEKRIIGDLSDTQAVIDSLGIDRDDKKE